MSESSEPPSDSQQVIDEEGSVDSQIKQRILNSRETVNQNENVLFTERLISPEVDLSKDQAIIAWGHSVKRYIRDVEILLRNERLEESRYYYKEVDLGQVTLYPPNKGGYEFTRFYTSDTDNTLLKKDMGLPKDMQVPEPYTHTFTGLEDIIESEEYVYTQWTVYTNKQGPPTEWDEMPLDAAQPVPKEVYEKAVRETDQFLQSAGIGIDIGNEQVDDKDTNPF